MKMMRTSMPRATVKARLLKERERERGEKKKMRELYVVIYGLLLGAPASFTVTTTPELLG